MNALASISLDATHASKTAAVAVVREHEEPFMREKLVAVRDVMIALGLQIMFRASILLQRWNY